MSLYNTPPKAPLRRAKEITHTTVLITMEMEIVPNIKSVDPVGTSNNSIGRHKVDLVAILDSDLA